MDSRMSRSILVFAALATLAATGPTAAEDF